MLKEIKTAEGISLSTNVILEGKVHVFNDSVKRQSFVLRYKNQILLYSECIKGRKVSSEITFITEGLINVKGINLHRVNNCMMYSLLIGMLLNNFKKNRVKTLKD